MTRPRGYVARWSRPPRPFVADERRWRRFRNTIFVRIADLRAMEGIDSRTAPWCTFDPPLPKRAPRNGPVRFRLMAASTHPRDPRTGRFLPGVERAS